MKKYKQFELVYNGKKYNIKDYVICNNIFSKARGLMFRSENYEKPLLFVWNKEGKYPIHSFFCRKFLAVWLLKGKIIEQRIVFPWINSITPKGKFDLLLEIPFKYFSHRR
jgi:uncharacterized membrane protein (UPF0127 family)